MTALPNTVEESGYSDPVYPVLARERWFCFFTLISILTFHVEQVSLAYQFINLVNSRGGQNSSFLQLPSLLIGQNKIGSISSRDHRMYEN